LALQSRLILFVAIGALLAMMGGFVLYASLDNPELEKVEISLHEVKIIDVNMIENKAKIEVSFLVKNPGEKTFTVPVISYKLYSDGMLVGSGQYSTEDIAMPGRAAFYPGSEIPLKNSMTVSLSDTNADLYNKLVSEQLQNFRAEGMITVETSWSLIEKEFQVEL
jgi:hypothetical protein